MNSQFRIKAFDWYGAEICDFEHYICGINLYIDLQFKKRTLEYTVAFPDKQGGCLLFSGRSGMSGWDGMGPYPLPRPHIDSSFKFESETIRNFTRYCRRDDLLGLNRRKRFLQFHDLG